MIMKKTILTALLVGVSGAAVAQVLKLNMADWQPKYDEQEISVTFTEYVGSSGKPISLIRTVTAFNVRDGVVTIGCKEGNKEVKVGEYFGCPSDLEAKVRPLPRWLHATRPGVEPRRLRVVVADRGEDYHGETPLCSKNDPTKSFCKAD